MSSHCGLIDDDPLVLSATGYGARVIKRPVVDGCPGYKLDARCWALHSSPDNGSIDALMIGVCLFKQAVGRGKPRARQAVLQYRVTEQVTAQRCLSESSTYSATGKDVIAPCLCHYHLLCFMRSRENQSYVWHYGLSAYSTMTLTGLPSAPVCSTRLDQSALCLRSSHHAAACQVLSAAF